MPREATLAVEEKLETEERGGGFEDYSEQPVLSSSSEETVPAQNREEKGKRKIKEQESSNSELFSLLTEIGEEMKMRDEQLKEELRWRDENRAVENRTREENLAAFLQQRDGEWKEELALRAELKEGEMVFCH